MAGGGGGGVELPDGDAEGLLALEALEGLLAGGEAPLAAGAAADGAEHVELEAAGGSRVVVASAAAAAATAAVGDAQLGRNGVLPWKLAAAWPRVPIGLLPDGRVPSLGLPASVDDPAYGCVYDWADSE